jgi:hypothetical protein
MLGERIGRSLARIVITPDVQGVSLRGFRSIDRAIDAGRRAAEDALTAGAKEALLAAHTEGAPTAAAPVLARAR